MHLPKMDECGLVLSVIHLQASSVGLLNDRFDDTFNDPTSVQRHRDAVAHLEFALWLFWHQRNVCWARFVFKQMGNNYNVSSCSGSRQ